MYFCVITHFLPVPSGYPLTLPGRSRAEHQHAVLLWPAPKNLVERLEAGEMSPKRPEGGYEHFLERLLLAEGVIPQEFWYAFKYCVFCDRIFLGEHTDYHGYNMTCWKMVFSK